ncbi:MAG TPA: ABC transporter substrate-binding protein [Bacillota bacterium]
MRRAAGLIVLLAIMVTVAACGGGSGDGDAQGGPIKIGFYSPVTGPASADGTSALRGAQLAVDTINRQGGVLGRQLELVDYDDAFSPDEAANITRRLIEQDGVVAVVSGSYSSQTRAGAPIAQEAGIPFVSAYGVHPSITQVGEYVWRIGALADVQGKAGAHLVVERLGARRVGMLVIDNDFGVSLADAFRQGVQDLGAEIVYEERYPLGETDFRALISGIAEADLDALYAIGYFAEAGALVRQLGEAGVEVQVVGQEGYDSPAFLELAGEHAEGVIITTDLDRDSERESVQDFLSGFQEAYDTPADMVAASVYDAVQVIAEAIEAGGSTEPEAMLGGLRSIENLDAAVTGPIMRFTEGREVVRPIGAQIVQDGAFHHFWEIDDPEVITPPW